MRPIKPALPHLAPAAYKANWFEAQQTGTGYHARWISVGAWRNQAHYPRFACRTVPATAAP
jgi:hypothetical protein